MNSPCSLIAVHGLGGDAKDTWTHPESKAFWLQDFLPQRHSDARIITFSYNAAVVFGESTAAVIDHAKSLLSSLVDKRENLNVGTYANIIAHASDIFTGGTSAPYIYRAFTGRYYRQRSEKTLREPSCRDSSS